MSEQKQPQNVLIASNHGLFAEGLRSLLSERPQADVRVVGVVTNLEEATQALRSLSPDVIIVDQDDTQLNRETFLQHLLNAEKQLRVVLLSLHEQGQHAQVYDRRTMEAEKLDDWLEEWTASTSTEQGIMEPHSKDADRRGSMKHLIIASLLVVVMTALLIVGLQFVPLLPEAASLQAEPIDFLFDLEFKVIAFLFSLIVVFIVYSIIVFRRRKDDLTDAKHIEGNTRLEIAWTVIPLGVVLYFAYIGGWSLAETTRIDPQAFDVDVIGSQWSWRFDYPELGITSSELVLPVNQQALLHLSSTDVIHSFWVPEFRVKQDALPGGDEFVRDLRITPTIIGDYTVRCAELCGLQHAYMLAPVRVLAQADFETWVAEQTAGSDDPVERGRQLYQTYGCMACHSIDGTDGVGPTWQGLFESERTFEDGSTTLADAEYLFNSIRNPGEEIVAGYANVMPADIAADMTDEQIQDVIQFIESLK